MVHANQPDNLTLDQWFTGSDALPGDVAVDRDWATPPTAASGPIVPVPS